MFDWNVVKQRVEALWAEFRIPMWVTEFDWNGDGEEVDFGDYTEYARILEDFYTLMFSEEVHTDTATTFHHETSSFSPSSGSLPGAPPRGTPRPRLPTWRARRTSTSTTSAGTAQVEEYNTNCISVHAI